jgi:hypothetical protein
MNLALRDRPRRYGGTSFQAAMVDLRLSLGQKMIWLVPNDQRKSVLQKQYPHLSHVIKTHEDMEAENGSKT